MITELVDFVSASEPFEKSASAPTTPTETTKFQHPDVLPRIKTRKGRRVNFPTDEEIVTGYFEPADPWNRASEISTDALLAAYQFGCEKQNIRPLPKIFKQLQSVKTFISREKELSLKGQRLDYKHVEALEEVFKRIQFEKIDLEGCSLDEEGAAALFDMIEYYESATFLNISFHKNIDSRGWQACSRMLKKTPCLQNLEIRNTNINEQMLLILGRALRVGSNLVSLRFENCGLTGRAIIVLVAAIKMNSTLRYLYLGDNKISSSDGIQLGNLLRTNTWMEVLDLHSNHLQDTGLIQVADGLKDQPLGPGGGLRLLNLANNHITHHGMIYLSKAMVDFHSLNELNLSHNNITDDGIQHLKQGLMTAQSLTHLGLQNTKITCEGGVVLAEFLADGKVIECINARENAIKIAGLMALSASMKHNTSILSLELDPVSIKDYSSVDSFEEHKALLNEIVEYCSRNKRDRTRRDESSPETPSSPKLIKTEKVQLTKAASTPASRFKVSRVVLEKGLSESSLTVLSSSAPAEMTPIHIQKSLDNLRSQLANLNGMQQQQQQPRTTYAGSSPLAATQSLDVTPQGVETAEKESSSAEGTTNPDVLAKVTSKPKKKLAFTLPEPGSPSSPRLGRKDRRMSTPAMPIAAGLRRPNPLKLCKQLESLDLRSSVPLSPTRLYEGWVFPYPPIELKLPIHENEEEVCWNCTHCASMHCP